MDGWMDGWMDRLHAICLHAWMFCPRIDMYNAFIWLHAPQDTDFSKLRIKALKKILKERGATCDGCTDKSDFVSKVKAVMEDMPAAVRELHCTAPAPALAWLLGGVHHVVSSLASPILASHSLVRMAQHRPRRKSVPR